MIGNEVSLVGNLTGDPELRFTASGTATASLSVAVNRVWTNKQTNQKEEAVSFFYVQTWSQMAENAAETLKKGDRIVVTGRLEQRSWEDKDGNRKTVVEIVADEVAPSLRYATALVTRNERSDTGAPAPRAAKPKPAAAAPVYEYDEEPFLLVVGLNDDVPKPWWRTRIGEQP